MAEKIKEAEFLRVAVPVSREEFRESIRPLARFLALKIYNAEKQNLAKEAAESTFGESYTPTGDKPSVQVLYSAKSGELA